MPSWLITGSSRGIGLHVVTALLSEETNFVIATARNPATSQGLQELARKYPKERLAVIQLDVSKQCSIDVAVEEVASICPNGLDYLVNNAGIASQMSNSYEDMDMEMLAEITNFSTVVPIIVTRSFLPLIRKSSAKKIIFISSVLGSVELAKYFSGVANSYAIARAALNMLARKWGAMLVPEGITVAIIHPGWVATEIGETVKDWVTTNAPHIPQIPGQESASHIIRISQEASLESTTSYYNYDGTILPW